jgi:hypothetical protein
MTTDDDLLWVPILGDRYVFLTLHSFTDDCFLDND